jgi:hypothetical protein
MPSAPIHTALSRLFAATGWAPPRWATSLLTDGDLIEAVHLLGSVPGPPRKGTDAIAVIVIQRDEIRSDATDVIMTRHPAEILVGGVSLTGEQAGTLIDLLDSARRLIEGAAE